MKKYPMVVSLILLATTCNAAAPLKSSASMVKSAWIGPVYPSTFNTPEILSENDRATFTQLDLYPNIETIGVVVTGVNLPKKADLMYRQSSQTVWHAGHPLVRIDDGRLVGSLFGLSAASSYDIKVLDGTTEITGSITTQPDELQFTPLSVLHVNNAAPSGGDGSAAAPFQTIQQGVNHAGPGTQVLVADGIYHEMVTFPSSGGAGSWIQVKAEGSGAILDGSDILTGSVWTPVEGKKNFWSTKIGAPIGYLARDQKRVYMYDDLSGLYGGVGHAGVPMNEGWYLAPNTTKLYVRSMDDPSSHTWQVPSLNRAFDVTGRDWIWIEGFEMRFYGQGDGCGVCALNSSHVVIRKNRIHNLQKGIFIEWTGGEDRGNDSRIEYNEIYDPPVNEWAWSAVKGSSMEGTAIIVRGHIGAIVRGNEVHNFFNGIYTGSSGALENSALAFDADIYDNHIHHISDDALEPEGACINQRFRNNLIDTSFVGISLAPITQGPTWVMRSVYTNLTGRGVKWDRNSDGVVLIYHNTFWTNTNNVNGMDLISAAHNALMRNNIFQVTGLAVNEMPTGSAGNDWNNDNWYTTRGPGSPHLKWENTDYVSLPQFCTATGLECAGYEDSPGLTNPAAGDFSLHASSPNIDRGALIPGVNDSFSGAAPDVGAYESAIDQEPRVLSIVRADADPTHAASVNFTVTFSEAVAGVNTVPPFTDFVLTASPGIAGSSVTSVTPVSVAAYTVVVSTGTGSGTLRLDIADDDSIVDAGAKSLGGAGAGNGNFTSGELYTVQKGIVSVADISRGDTDPSNRDQVHFTVTFSDAVTGVDTGDFALTVAGGISGATLVGVTGSGTTYSIAISTGTGDGTLGLDLLDNDSIVDAMNYPLGGSGPGNGNSSSAGNYTIDKTGPIAIGSLRIDPDPTSSDVVSFRVVFSEVVAGVDSGDFSLVASGDISGAGITAVSAGDQANSFTVVVATGTGNGTLRLDLGDNDSIVDAGGLPLGGAGAGNGSFAGGEIYTISTPTVSAYSDTFISNGTSDGWVLESGEDSKQGGSKNATATTFNLGDDKRDRQFRAILHFPTASLPDNAVVTMAILMIRRQGGIGSDPFLTHQNINIDIRRGYFGSTGLFGMYGLDLTDFRAVADGNSIGTIYNNPVDGWYWSMLDPSAFAYVNLTGVTQLRLNFQLDDNDDRGDDYLKFYSGNAKSQPDRPQFLIKYYLPTQALAPPPSSPDTPVAGSTTVAVNPMPKWSVGDRGVKWAEVAFEDIAPRGMDMRECWNAMGMDDEGRVYIGFTSVRADGRQDFAVFRLDPRTGERLFLGSFLDIVAAAGNASAGEGIPKGHTRMIFANGRMFMGSQSFHDLKWEIDSLPTYRGSHLFSFEASSGTWRDLSAGLPGGVITEHEGIISLNVLPQDHLLIGLAHPSSDIVIYDYQSEQLVKIMPGIPWKLGNPLSRELIVAPSGNIYSYRGTEAVAQRQESHTVWVQNIHSGETRDTGFQMTNGFWVGQTRRRDGSKIYLNTIGGELYEFDVASETFRDLGYELPATDGRTINYTYSLTLSPDETKLCYILSVIQKPGGALGNGSGGSGELYYYDLATGQVVFAQQLPVGIYTSADLRDNQYMYFSHFGSGANIWSGSPRLFIIQLPA